MKINRIVFIVILSVCLIVTLLTIIIKPKEIYDSDFGNHSNIYKDNLLDTTYLKLSNVNLSNSSSYNYCSGLISISNSSPYKYHYIKVKASFLNKNGTVIDTDWTYAIGSEWLEPGESSKFKLSVEKDYNISKCVVTIMED